MIWSWLFPSRVKPVKARDAKSVERKASTQLKVVLSPTVTRAVDRSPVIPIAVPDPVPAPPDATAAAAAAAAGAVFLYSAEMAMHNGGLASAGQPAGADNSAAVPGPADSGPGNAGGSSGGGDGGGSGS